MIGENKMIAYPKVLLACQYATILYFFSAVTILALTA
jgi:hypothetical protein